MRHCKSQFSRGKHLHVRAGFPPYLVFLCMSCSMLCVCVCVFGLWSKRDMMSGGGWVTAGHSTLTWVTSQSRQTDQTHASVPPQWNELTYYLKKKKKKAQFFCGHRYTRTNETNHDGAKPSLNEVAGESCQSTCLKSVKRGAKTLCEWCFLQKRRWPQVFGCGQKNWTCPLVSFSNPFFFCSFLKKYFKSFYKRSQDKISCRFTIS